MARQILILCIIIVVCASFLFFLLQLGNKPEPILDGDGDLPIASSSNGNLSLPTTPTITIDTTQGAVVVNNFFKNSRPVAGSDAVYLKTSSAAYTIIYYPQAEMLNVTLLQKPIAQFKEAAEKELLEILKIPPEELCKLQVSVGTIISVDADLAGKELGLSFCQ